MKKHFKVLRYFLLPTVTFILLRWAYYLSFSKAIEIITSNDAGLYRVALIIVEIIFYIILYHALNKTNKESIYMYESREQTEKLCKKIEEEIRKKHYVEYCKDGDIITITLSNDRNNDKTLTTL